VTLAAPGRTAAAEISAKTGRTTAAAAGGDLF